MKSSFQWLFALAFLFSGVCVSKAMPAADMDYMCALLNYNIGVRQITSDPQAAVKTLLKAQQWIQKSRDDGADYKVDQLSQLIGHELMIARTAKVANRPAGSPRQNNIRPLGVPGSPAMVGTF